MANTNGRATGAAPRGLDLRAIVRAARRSPLLSLGVPIALLASTGFFLWWVEPTYSAMATLRVDEDRSGVAIIEALQTLSSGSEISTEMEELRSRTLAEEVVDSLDLHVTLSTPRKVERSTVLAAVEAARTAAEARYTLDAEADGTFRLTGDGIEPRTVRVGETIAVPAATFMLADGASRHEHLEIEVTPFAETVRDFRRDIGVDRPNREADFIAVRYQGADRDIVRAVPNLMARRFIARRNDVRTREARSTAEFLDEQIAALTDELNSAQDALRDYRERYGVVSLEAEGEAQVSRLADMQAQREMYEVTRSALAATMRQIESTPRQEGDPSPYRALVGFPALLTSTAASDLLASLHELEAERSELLERYTIQEPRVVALTERIRATDRQLHALATTYLNGVTATIASLDQTLAGFERQLQQIPEKELQLARLRRQTQVSEELYGELQLRLKEAEILAAVEDPSVRVVDPAIEPREPVSPNVPLSLAVALFAGALLGVGGAVAREQLDDTVRTRDELQRIAGVPVLGAIPRIAVAAAAGGNGERRRGRRRTADRLAARMADDAAGTPVTEAYRSLRTSISFSRGDGRPRVLVLTSPAPGDGKSTTAANLAATMAQQGLRCLLIDADLRRGLLHEVFGVRREPGLSDVLIGDQLIADVVHRADGQPDLLTTGTPPPNPAELLGAPAMATLVEHVRETYDVVLLDAPPMNLVTDAAVLARIADGVIVVARAGVTSRGAITFTLDQLSSVSAPVLGSVLNDADVRREGHYGSYMQTYYHAET